MLFSHDTEATLRAACVLVNSDRVDGEQLGDQAALNAYLSGHGWTGRRDHDAAELAAVHRLRARLGRIWSAASGDGDAVEGAGVDERTVEEVNALLSDTHAAPWLTRHPEMPDWHLHLASNGDPLAQRMGAEMAMALADLIRSGELRRLKICAAPNCDAVLIDLSRNRSRMFCDTGNCGNRQHVAAYRERRSKDG
ncbi:CGNR zinc finger domain-containing protein [Mycolicibacterium sp.]|uniref:CGNR zinc finger domain-containing protein n=1 Tax=Mycolicibacterium sp. TaxID=2320850 RepID=UPI0025D557B6|nr:CGNR zinc finger domain-containing protein [Mycolicibacterium sp.]